FHDLHPAVHHFAVTGDAAEVHVVFQRLEHHAGGISFFYDRLAACLSFLEHHIMRHQLTVDEADLYDLSFFRSEHRVAYTFDIASHTGITGHLRIEHVFAVYAAGFFFSGFGRG